MTERMTEVSWTHYKQDAEWSRIDRINVTVELDRARRVEEEQAELLRKKDEAIRALTGALVLLRAKYEPVLNTGHIRLIDEALEKVLP